MFQIARYLAFDGSFNLRRVKVAFTQLLVHVLKGNTLCDVNGIQHIAQTLAHLPAMGVTHHCVQKDLREWKLSG